MQPSIAGAIEVPSQNQDSEARSRATKKRQRSRVDEPWDQMAGTEVIAAEIGCKTLRKSGDNARKPPDTIPQKYAELDVE